MKVFGIVVGLLLLMFGLGWVLQGNSFFLYKVFAPKYENVRRQVFEQTKSYNQGMQQEISNMQFEYIQATPEQKQALASIILHRVADYDINKLNPDLQEFIHKLREEM